MIASVGFLSESEVHLRNRRALAVRMLWEMYEKCYHDINGRKWIGVSTMSVLFHHCLASIDLVDRIRWIQ